MSLCINLECEYSRKFVNQENHLFCIKCGSNLLINDLYRVEKYIGSGGFGTTYLVSESGQKRVLKVLHNNDPKAKQLFDQEATVLENLRHPGIPKVRPGDRFDFRSRGSNLIFPCFVMEYITGENLETYMQNCNYQGISEKAAFKWLRELLNILALIHSANYFHRDIKPSNIMIRNDGSLALIDFGVSRINTATYVQKKVNHNVTRIISPGYSPYEQSHGFSDKRSDFFALGRTFVYLLTGKHPDSFRENVSDGLAWRQNAKKYNHQLLNLIDEMMHPDIEKRPKDASIIIENINQIERTLHKSSVMSNNFNVVARSESNNIGQKKSYSKKPTVKKQSGLMLYIKAHLSGAIIWFPIMMYLGALGGSFEIGLMFFILSFGVVLFVEFLIYILYILNR